MSIRSATLTGSTRADRWVPGEFARCLDTARWFRRAVSRHRSGPIAGDVAKVRSVIIRKCPWTGKPVEMLTFDRWSGSTFPSSHFCKADKPKFTLRSIRSKPKRASRIRAAVIVTAVFSTAATIAAQLLGDEG